MASTRRPPKPGFLLAILAVAMLAACGDDGDAVPSDQSELSEQSELSDQSVETIDDELPALQPTDRTVQVGGGEITVVDVQPPGGAATGRATVLFLHGAAYSSQTWIANDILSVSADAGHRAIAVDLPGFGASDSVDVAEAEFLAALFGALELEPSATVVVSPSMSGIFSLPALRDPFFADLAGYVPVAPSGAASFADDGPPVGVPALLVWGDGDGADPQAAAERLAEGFTSSAVVIIADAGHAAYEDQPTVFADALLSFIESLGL